MNYVRNTWYVAGWSVDLEDQKPMHIDILGEPIVIYRGENGQLAALEDRCIHRLAPLSLGRCEGNHLRCMYHGIRFNQQGEVDQIPGQEKIPGNAKIKTYPIADKHSWLWVWMGDPASADEALIPAAIGYDNPDYILGHGQLDYEAEARLINDNLLDFSHLTYVHAESFKAPDDFAQNPPKITQLERGVRFERWVTNRNVLVSTKDQTDSVDSWSSYDFVLPGILLMYSGSFAPGTAEACNFEAPDLSKAINGVTHTSQAVTPTGEKASRYFFNWGPHKDHGDEKLRDTLMGIAAQAFAEDKVMIEAQQQVINNTSEPKIMATIHDKGVILFNRMVEKLVSAEASKNT